MCCVFIWSWNPSFVLNTLAHTSHIRWSIRSCTFRMCIFSMCSDLKLFPLKNENFGEFFLYKKTFLLRSYFFLQMSHMNFWSPIGCTSLKWRFRMCWREKRLWHWWHSKLRFSSSKWRKVCAINVLFSWNFFGHFSQLQIQSKFTKSVYKNKINHSIQYVLECTWIDMPSYMFDDSTS